VRRFDRITAASIAVVVALTGVAVPLALAQFSNSGGVGPGSPGYSPSSPAQNWIQPNAIAIAALPPCTAAWVGWQAMLNNAQTSPAWNGAVSSTGAVYAAATCIQTGSSSFGWVYR
jgi:hypothetical protein